MLLVALVQLDNKGLREQQDRLEAPELMASRDSRVRKVCQDLTAQQVTRVRRGQKVRLDHLELLAVLVNPDSLDRLEHRDPLGQLGLQVAVDPRDQQVSLD